MVVVVYSVPQEREISHPRRSSDERFFFSAPPTRIVAALGPRHFLGVPHRNKPARSSNRVTSVVVNN